MKYRIKKSKTNNKNPIQKQPLSQLEDLPKSSNLIKMDSTTQQPQLQPIARTPANILHLQRTIGNQAVIRLLNNSQQQTPIQREDGDDESSDDDSVSDDQLSELDNDDDVSDSEIDDADVDDIVPEGDEEDAAAELTPQQRIERKINRIDAEIGRLKTAKTALATSQRVIMLPLTIIDRLSSIGMFKGKRATMTKKGKKKARKEGRTGLFAMSAGLNIHTLMGSGKGKLHVGPKVGHLRPFAIKNMPWNVLLWVSRILQFRIKALEKKKNRLRMRRGAIR